MPQKDKDIITEAMGVEPVMFNASLVSAQTRKRLFWTNIKFELPMDRGIILKDILQEDAEVDERMVNKDKKAYTLTANYAGAILKHSVEKKQRTMVVCNIGTKEQDVLKKPRQSNRVYSINHICPTLTSNPVNIMQEKKEEIHETAQTGRNETKKLGYVGDKDHQAKRFYDSKGKIPALNAICNSMVKVGRLVGRRLNSKGKREDDNKELECNQVLEVRDDEKTNNLSTVQKDNVVVNTENFTIRKLTPIECERLQSLPDNYTEGVSTTQRYKCLGNAFNAEVIAHILQNINI